jgi:hypothetical protein
VVKNLFPAEEEMSRGHFLAVIFERGSQIVDETVKRLKRLLLTDTVNH